MTTKVKAIRSVPLVPSSLSNCWAIVILSLLLSVVPSSHVQAFVVVPGATKTTLSTRRSSSTRICSTTSSSGPIFQVAIEYCTGCKWGLRAFWTAQELLSTFRDDVALGAVSVVPSTVSGRFAVTAARPEGNNNDDEAAVVVTTLWDRQEADGFPEMKDLKQLIRDEINPQKFLGHSDSMERQQQQQEEDNKQKGETILDLSQDPLPRLDRTLSPADIQGVPSPHVTITYCTGCQWLLRAAYVAQELMSTFGEDVAGVTLIPSRKPAKGGAFLVTVDGTVVWDRFQQGRFPETKELKQLVRNLLDPDRDLGHIDRPKSEESKAAEGFEEMDDEEAEEARRFFGVM